MKRTSSQGPGADDANPKTKVPKVQTPTSTAASSTPPASNNSNNSQALRVQDALTYLDLVKRTYLNEPHVYARFLEIMKEFKNHVIDTPGVIQKVSELFKNHNQLILGFNSFLPPGYKIELDQNDVLMQSYTHTGGEPGQTKKKSKKTETVSQVATSGAKTETVPQAAATTSSSSKTETRSERSIDFEQAISYVTKIKKRFADSPTTYKAFLDILHNYQKQQTTIKKVYEQVSELFRDHNDLLHEFAQFLPMPVEKKPTRKVKKQSQSAPSAGDDKKRRTSRITSKSKQLEDFDYYEEPPQFFNDLKERLGIYEYNQILKAINLYTTDIIDRSELLDMISENEALRKNSDLFKKLKKLISTNTIDENLPKRGVESRPQPPSSDSKSSTYGPSYRLQSKNYSEPICSERTELCHQVLNDEFVSVPAGSEESRDIQKKSQYDEIIYQCEDDKTELDIVIDQNVSTIKFFTSFMEKINNDETITNFGIDSLKDIHKATINRIYADKGNDILEGLRKNPTIAIPIVYKRLKQKDEEWRKAKKELNRFWLDIYEKNFQKAMESQYNTFKNIEKKRLQFKNIFKDIKQRHDYSRPMVFDFPDKSIHDDIYYMLINLTNELTDEEISSINQLWTDFLIPFLDLTALEYQKTERYDSSIKEVPEGESPNSNPIVYFADLFTQTSTSTPLANEFPPIVEQQLAKESQLRNNVFYANSYFLLFFRFYCSLYEKLYRAKEACKRAFKLKKREHDTATVLKDHDTLLEKSAFNNEKKEKEREKAIEEMTTVGGSSATTDNMEIDSNTTESPEDLYSQFMVLMIRFLNGLGTASSYEEECKKLLGYDSYIVFTFDRVFVEFQKHVYTMISEHQQMCTDFMELFKYELQRVNKFVDNSYRLNIQKLIGDEVCYILEYNKRAQKSRIDEIDPPEVDLEKLDAENKALRYVQEFLLGVGTRVDLARESNLYLARNKSKVVSGKDSNQLFIRNKLECKICIATFKLYFVEDTEDLMFRKSEPLSKAAKDKRSSRWNKLLEQKLAQAEQQPTATATTTSND